MGTKKAVRRMHYPPPDGFARPLGGESLDSSTAALRFVGKTAPTRFVRDYTQFGLPDFWAFVLVNRRFEMERTISDAGRWGRESDAKR